MATFDARNSSTKGSSRSALILVGVLALLGLAYALIRVDVLRARIVEVRLELEKVQTSNTALLNRLALLNEDTQSSTDRLKQLQTDLGSVSESVNELRGGAALAQRQSARSETLYLLRLANDQLQLGRDLISARNSLNAADSVLRQADDPANAAVHQQVLRALQLLQKVPDDAAQLDEQLRNAEQQVAQLKLAGVLLGSAANEVLPEAGLARVWAVFKQGWGRLVTISNTGAEANAVLDQDAQQLRRRHLQLLLLDARVARYLRDQKGYVAALQSAQTWLQKYFDASDARVAALSLQLRQWTQHDIAPELPELSTSIQALTRQLPQASPEASTPGVTAP